MTTATDDVQTFLDEVRGRIEHGANDYADQNFLRPVAATVHALLCESVDQTGWLFVLWCQAARKTSLQRDQQSLRAIWFRNIEHRLRRNDRGNVNSHGDHGLPGLMDAVEVLALDLFLQHQSLRRRLLPIARAIEVAQVLERETYRGRHGSVRDPRSDD